MRILSRGSSTKLWLATALFLTTSRADSVDVRSSDPQIRQVSPGAASDTLCSDVMCIECGVDGATARYVLRTTGKQELGWMAIGFGQKMGDSPMVIVWPSRGADGAYESVALSQRKAPYEIMPTPDPDPPFTARLSLTDTWVTVENPQITFTREAPPDGMQNIIWAFSRTPPESSDPGATISIHHRIGRGKLNLTRIAPIPDEQPPLPPPPPPVHPVHSHPEPIPAPAPEPVPEPEPELEHEDSDEKAEGEGKGKSEDGSGGGGFASFAHGALCTAAFLLVIPSGALVVRYAKVTGSPKAFQLHRLLQLAVAGASIAGGMLAYLFMNNNHGGSSAAHKVGGVGLLLLYALQCTIGSWVHRTPAESRTGAQSALLAGLGAAIVLLAFFETWLGLVSAGRDTFVWSALLIVVPSLYILGVMTVQRRSVQEEDAKGEYVALATRAPQDDELEDGGEKL